jgi:hypothetical protein
MPFFQKKIYMNKDIRGQIYLGKIFYNLGIIKPKKIR